MNSSTKSHKKCTNSTYPRSSVERQHLHDNQVDWSMEMDTYDPPAYTSDSIFGKPYADPDVDKNPSLSSSIPWNQMDQKANVDRKSFEGDYCLTPEGLPRNPIGRTGLKGRGLLGRWGPNHAADPIVTRWARNKNNCISIDKTSGKPILQFVAIERKDSKEWALPGGMVDPGEAVSQTLKREFGEETLDSLGQEDGEKIKESIEEKFKHGVEIYKGYVDDPRNTDNSWMETVAHNFHDDQGDLFHFSFKAGDDATSVKWIDVNKDMELYASHSQFIEEVVKMRGAHW